MTRPAPLPWHAAHGAVSDSSEIERHEGAGGRAARHEWEEMLAVMTGLNTVQIGRIRSADAFLSSHSSARSAREWFMGRYPGARGR